MLCDRKTQRTANFAALKIDTFKELSRVSRRNDFLLILYESFRIVSKLYKMLNKVLKMQQDGRNSVINCSQGCKFISEY